MVSGRELYQLMNNSVFVKRAQELAESPLLLFPLEHRKYGPYWTIEWMGTDRKQWKGGENEAIISIHPAEAYLRGSGGPWVDADAKILTEMIETRLNTPLKDANVNANYRLPVTSDDFPIEAGYYVLRFHTDHDGDVTALVPINPISQEIGLGGGHDYHPHLALMMEHPLITWDGETFVSGDKEHLTAMLMNTRSNVGWGKLIHEDLVSDPAAINYSILPY